MQYKASTDAQKRRTRETQLSIQRQQELQRQAEQKALGEAQQFNTDDRAQAQQVVEQELTEEFIKPVENSAEMNAAATTTQGDVSADYVKANAASKANLEKNARVLAGLLGKITGANRLRQNEAIRFADTAAGIDRLASFSRGQHEADKVAIYNAGVPDAGMQIGGQFLQGVGYLGASGAFGGTTSGAASSEATVADWFTKTGGRQGATAIPANGSHTGPIAYGGGGTGFKAPKGYTSTY